MYTNIYIAPLKVSTQRHALCADLYMMLNVVRNENTQSVQKTKHSKLKESPVVGHIYALWNQTMVSVNI